MNSIFKLLILSIKNTKKNTVNKCVVNLSLKYLLFINSFYGKSKRNKKPATPFSSPVPPYIHPLWLKEAKKKSLWCHCPLSSPVKRSILGPFLLVQDEKVPRNSKRIILLEFLTVIFAFPINFFFFLPPEKKIPPLFIIAGSNHSSICKKLLIHRKL